ncbi:MAG: anti-sigma factor [Chitinophagales bacterium]|nr:anti-sigma factor [Chitinophagales bacterium]MDW8428679.1 anti-sigma factor [Chitinophagales bacterium]
MNARELIESGLLECYCLGLLSNEEMQEIEAMARQHQEVRDELQRIQHTLETYVRLHETPPPPSVKQRLLARLGRKQPSSAIPIQDRVPRLFKAAAALALMVFAAALMALLVQTNRLQQQLSQLRQHLQELEAKNQALHELALSQSEQLLVLSDPHTTKVELRGKSEKADYFAVVYWNRITHIVFLDVKNMPLLPADKQYQLWFLTKEQQAVDAGVFEPIGGLMRMKDVPEAQAFAVTIEPRGGSVQPTLDQMVVFGQVPS